jgi:hypothetical protein
VGVDALVAAAVGEPEAAGAAVVDEPPNSSCNAVSPPPVDAAGAAAVDEAEAVVALALAGVPLVLAGMTCAAFGSASNVAGVEDAASESALSKLSRASRDAGAVVFPVTDVSGPVENMLCT